MENPVTSYKENLNQALRYLNSETSSSSFHADPAPLYLRSVLTEKPKFEKREDNKEKESDSQFLKRYKSHLEMIQRFLKIEKPSGDLVLNVLYLLARSGLEKPFLYILDNNSNLPISNLIKLDLSLLAQNNVIEKDCAVLFNDDLMDIVNESDKGRHSTLMHKAIAADNDIILKKLIEKGADLSVKSDWEIKMPENEKFVVNCITLLQEAAGYGSEACLEILLTDKRNEQKIKEQINYSNKYLYNPLQAAAIRGHIACARLLIQNGANPRARCPQGKLAYEIAENNGHMLCSRTILSLMNNNNKEKNISDKEQDSKEKELSCIIQ